jgi:hypothetical protein
MITERSWILISYLLGSIPSGFLIAKAYGKNVLEIGWRKTSGSNVFRNVGKLAGVLTAVLDILKGFIAVFVAQKLGFSPLVQVFSGLAAVIGHNWSIFIKFAGGRGIGTLAGCLLAFSPKITGLSLIVFIIPSIVWNTSIGTLVFLAVTIIFSFSFEQFNTVGLFIAFSLIPILIKRLSPIKEIYSIKETPTPERGQVASGDKISRARPHLVWGLFRNRILFDNDEALFSLRINRILKGIENNKFLKFLADTILLPPKIGWRVTKFGVKVGVSVVKKPIEFIFGSPEKVVTEIKPGDLKEMMKAAAQKVVQHQEEINKINVFPVADKDTGYNLAATLLGIEGVIAPKKYNSFSEITEDIKEGAMINARGNAGMIYTGYLIGFLNKIKDLKTIDSLNLSSAMRKGTDSAYHAILNPVEGTILDVVRAAGKKSTEITKERKERNIIKVLGESLVASQKALAETKEKLEVLKQNNVVDAGGLGFVKILEAWVESLKGEAVGPKEDLETSAVSIYQNAANNEKLDYKKEVIFIINKEEPRLEKLKADLALLGGSIDILESEDKVKIHIHTDSPEGVRALIKDFKTLDWREENLEINRKQGIGKKPLGLVVGETANIPRGFLEKNSIECVPFRITFPGGELVGSENFYENIKKAKKLPTSSAAVFSDYFDCYKRALEKFENILVITLPSRLSGAYSQARIARSIFKKPEKLNIFVFDCFTAEVAEGLIVMRAQELISEGKKIEEVIDDLKTFCPKVKLLGFLSDIKYLVRGGRFKIPWIFTPLVSLIQKAGISLLFSLENGKIKLLGVRLGKNLAKFLAEEVEKRSENKKIRAAISHTSNPKAAEELRKALETNPKIKILFTSVVTPVIGIHTGPDALIVGFHSVIGG